MQTRHKILNFIQAHSPTTAHLMLGEVNIKRPMLHRHLKKLITEGQITKTGTPPKVFYHFGHAKSDLVSNDQIPGELQQYVNQKPYLHWWVSNRKKLSLPSIVSAILNYGDFSDVEFLIKVLGKEKVKNIYKELLTKRNDFRPSTINFFNLYFHA